MLSKSAAKNHKSKGSPEASIVKFHQCQHKASCSISLKTKKHSSTNYLLGTMPPTILLNSNELHSDVTIQCLRLGISLKKTAANPKQPACAQIQWFGQKASKPKLLQTNMIPFLPQCMLMYMHNLRSKQMPHIT